ncbi:unnamed protein product [Onchocerca ochengi]|uniref:WD repeat-containing protein 44-like n=1 Tax=Onchocerca ochengi TaxID=42157 RepID=A0A182E1Z4_ONCOC|nr:unnamed protein product [Onchocerca ochengi]
MIMIVRPEQLHDMSNNFSLGMRDKNEKLMMESKPITDCGENLENEERQLSNEKQCGGDIGNANKIDVACADLADLMGISADTSKVISLQGDDCDRTHKRLSKPVDLNEDKYTGDEESADSSDSEVEVSKKYRKKKFKGNMNTFNISSGTQSLQVGKRLSVAERSLQQSLNYSGERNQSPSSFADLSDRNSAGMIQVKRYEAARKDILIRMDNIRVFLSYVRDKSFNELNKVPYGSYSVPSPAAGQSISHQGKLSEGTQTDENWLENLLDELGCHNSLSSLPQIVGLFYSTPLNPEKDQNYRKTWREIVRDHCSAEILIAPLPNGEEVLIKK